MEEIFVWGSLWLLAGLSNATEYLSETSIFAFRWEKFFYTTLINNKMYMNMSVKDTDVKTVTQIEQK